MDGAVIFEIMHSNAIEILKSGRGPEPFDAILVDEGQDIRPDWWNALRLNLSPDGEMLLFADATQDIYETNSSWTDEAMTGAGFAGGRWSELKTSYRIPEKLAPYARSFAEKFLSELPVNLPEVDQREIDYFKCELRWIDAR